jgi:hypothetical protein
LTGPALWVLAWTLHLRLRDFVAMPTLLLRGATLLLPLVATLVPVEATGSRVFFALSALNFVAFARVTWTQRGNRLALHLMLVSLAATVAALPVEVVHPVAGYFDRVKFIGLAALAYLVISSALARNPKFAIAGGLAAALAGGWSRGGHADAVHWAAQSGLVFFLLHSLRWRDYEHQGAVVVRAIVAVAWVVHTLVWVRGGAAFLHPLFIAVMVLVICWLRAWVRLNWSPVVVPVAGLLVALCGPANLAFVELQATPAGIVAIASSFLLFGLGTIAALTKHRWKSNGPKALATRR